MIITFKEKDDEGWEDDFRVVNEDAELAEDEKKPDNEKRPSLVMKTLHSATLDDGLA